MEKLTKNRLKLIDDERILIKSWESCKCADISHFNLDFNVYEKKLESLDCTIFKKFSILEVQDNERFKRLKKFVDLCNNGNTCCSISETVQNQFYREFLIFYGESPSLAHSTAFKDCSESDAANLKTRAILSRGLLDVFLNSGKNVLFPFNSFSSQLHKDVLSINFLQSMFKIGTTLRIPIVLPYNSVPDLIYLYELGIFQDETTWSPYVESEFMRLLFSNGFITISFKVNIMGVEKVLLLPKMHDLRCCMKPQDILVSKKVKKLSKKLKITINTCFHEVIKGIVENHGEDWMYPEVQLEFMKMHYFNGMCKTDESNVRGKHDLNGSNDLDGDSIQVDNDRNSTTEVLESKNETNDTFVKNDKTVVSVEVWNGDNLVAGEIGFVNGSMYTSISGFHRVNNSGNFQLVALAAILYFNGFKLWDLGMEIPYKLEMGAKCILRKDFLRQLNQLKNSKLKFEVPAKYAEKTNGEELIGDFLKAINRHSADS